MTTITTIIDPPLPTDTPAVFNTKAFEAWGDINTWAGQANTVAGEVNTNAGIATTKAGEALASANAADLSETNAGTSATTAQNWATSLTVVSGGLYGARYYAQQAEAAVASLPDGAINDAITTTSDAWSSTKTSAELDTKLSKAGGTLTGKLAGTVLSMVNYVDKTVTNAATIGATTLNLALGDAFDLTLTGAATLSLSNIPTLSSETLGFVVRVTQGGTAYGLTWFSGITWLTTGGTAPDAPAANKTIEYVFTTKNGTAFQGRKGAAT